MSNDQTITDGNEGGEKPPTPPFIPPTDEEVGELSESGERLLGPVSIDFPINDILKATKKMLKSLPLCPTMSKATGEKHGLPEIDIDDSAKDQILIATNLITLDNLRKFIKGGYVEGVTYRPLTSKKRGELCTVVRKGGTYILQTMDHEDSIIQLEEVACWIKEVKEKKSHKGPKKDVKNGITRQTLPLPVLRSVLSVPRWSLDPEEKTFHLHHKIGYDPQTATFIARDFGIKRATAPTKAEVTKALDVLNDLIGEFPYAEGISLQGKDDDESFGSSYRNALALAVSLPMRNIFLTMPIVIVDAEDPASGKTLLVETLHCAYLGFVPTLHKMAYNEGVQERRNITAMVRDADTDTDVFWLDEIRKSNQTSEIVSDTLNAIATAAAGKYKDRPVYQKEAIDLDVQRTFIITGNNLRLGPELQRRTLKITLQRNGVQFTRTEDELREHAVASQEAYHQAVATLVDNWIAKGSPAPQGSGSFPSFNTWLGIIGGILEAAGVVGLRQNPNIVGPYTAARADWLFWMHKMVTDDEVTHKAVVTKLADPDTANQETIKALLENLLHYADKSDVVAWERLYHNVVQNKDCNLMLSKVMQMFTVATWETAEHSRIHFKRLSKGTSDGVSKPVRYRLTTSETAKLDKRGGNTNVATGKAKRTVSRAPKSPKTG